MVHSALLGEQTYLLSAECAIDSLTTIMLVTVARSLMRATAVLWLLLLTMTTVRALSGRRRLEQCGRPTPSQLAMFGAWSLGELFDHTTAADDDDPVALAPFWPWEIEEEKRFIPRQRFLEAAANNTDYVLLAGESIECSNDDDVERHQRQQDLALCPYYWTVNYDADRCHKCAIAARQIEETMLCRLPAAIPEVRCRCRRISIGGMPLSCAPVTVTMSVLVRRGSSCSVSSWQRAMFDQTIACVPVRPEASAPAAPLNGVHQLVPPLPPRNHVI